MKALFQQFLFLAEALGFCYLLSRLCRILIARLQWNWLYHLLSLIGVCSHEVGHLVFAIVTGEKVISFVPYTFSREKQFAGVVEHTQSSWFSGLLISFGPILMGVFLSTMILLQLVGHNGYETLMSYRLTGHAMTDTLALGNRFFDVFTLKGWGSAVSLLGIFSICSHWFPSSQDVRNGFFSLLIFLGLLYLGMLGLDYAAGHGIFPSLIQETIFLTGRGITAINLSLLLGAMIMGMFLPVLALVQLLQFVAAWSGNGWRG